MREITKEWVFKAEGDYRSAEALLYQIEIPEIDTACFHCQQCAEKYVKAFLIEHNVDFPRNHDLVRLLVLCLTVDESFETIRDYLRRLENYAVIIRYPGLIVPLELAQEAFENASRVRGFVKKKLKVR
jgi:HEPN domain-containing protein